MSPMGTMSARAAVSGVSRRTRPRNATPVWRQCAHSARPTKPSAPVTTTSARPFTAASSPGSEPSPSVAPIEAHRAGHEVIDVAQSLACRAAAVVSDLDAGHIGRPGDTIQPHAPVEVLEIEKKTRIEAARLVDRRPLHEHERAGQRLSLIH